MLVVHLSNESIVMKYEQWKKSGGKPIQWEVPPFEIEIFFGHNGFLLYTWHPEKTTFELEVLTYFHLRYSASVHFYNTSTPKHMDTHALEKRYRSDNHQCTRWFELMCIAYEQWWDAGRPTEFRFLA